MKVVWGCIRGGRGDVWDRGRGLVFGGVGGGGGV